MALNKLRHEFDPFELTGVEVPKKNRADALEEVEAFLHEQILSHVGDATSPVSGERWKASLSPGYKAYKSKFSSNNTANLELTGAMLDALDVYSSRGKIVTEIEGKEAAKADGHCNFSGDSDLPRRRFIPGKGQKYKQDIINGIKDILEKYAEEE